MKIFWYEQGIPFKVTPMELGRLLNFKKDYDLSGFAEKLLLSLMFKKEHWPKLYSTIINIL